MFCKLILDYKISHYHYFFLWWLIDPYDNNNNDHINRNENTPASDSLTGVYSMRERAELPRPACLLY